MPATASLTREQTLAARCLEALRTGERWLEPAEALLQRAASGENSIAEPASRALFGRVVEPLADSFDPSLSPVYREFFGWLLLACRPLPGFEPLDDALTAVGIRTVEDLLRRSEAAVAVRPTLPSGGPRCIVLPSRVTLGADIAVVSVLIAGLRWRFPQAHVLFAAGSKNLDLFSGASAVDALAAPYPRTGSLRDRLAVWPALLRLLDAELAGVADDELLLVDPDSRMTQLGLLPLRSSGADGVSFDSRAFGGDSDRPLAQLSADWLDEVFGPSDVRPLPWTTFQPRRDCRTPGQPLVAVSFGVGGNASKRVGDPFEAGVLDLLLDRGWRIALDRGFGPAEQTRTEALAERVRQSGGLVHDGSFRGFGEIVTAADLFVGYDSAFGHLAAAMGVPGVTVFAGAVSPRMLQRWSPFGRGRSTVLPVTEGDSPDAVLERVRKALP
ncbi:MAG: hypothetical protein GC160_28445 [Acidobacteria bacterium]|nr:hypothetical protein [Acidobacteriota bacterium]